MRNLVFFMIGLPVVFFIAGCSKTQSAFDSDVEFLKK